jgi:hypothetical protein
MSNSDLGGDGGVDGKLHFPVPFIKPSLQKFQYCRFGRSSAILFFLFYQNAVKYRAI